MTAHGARSSALIAAAAFALSTHPVEAQRMDENASAARAASASENMQGVSKWALCGKGQYDFAAGGQAVGSETFEITCHPDRRYTAAGRTQLTVGTAMDLTTTLELGADLLPTSASSKGSVRGQPFEQTGTYSNGTATLVTNGQSQSIPYTQGASWMGGNIFFPHAFILARYDEAKGGAQQVALFPTISATVERVAQDGVKTDGGESALFTRFVVRIAPHEMLFWRDAEGRLALIAVPGQQFTASRPESAKWVAPLLANLTRPGSSTSDAVDYSAPANAPFTAEEVKIAVSSYSLAGTLLLPKTRTRPVPAVVMITGSGLQTRDSRIALTGLEKYAPFRQIAERLAAQGVAVLRADDRGAGGSTGRETLEKATTTSLAEDTRAQIAWLRTRTEIDPARITLIGHSEGASIATMIGASDPKLRAVVLMGGPAKRGADIAIEQHEDVLRSDTTMTEATRADLRAKQKEAVNAVLAGGEIPGQKANAWVREYFTYDPLETIRKVRQPILILQGEHDRQIAQSHAVLLANAARSAGNSRVTTKVFPTLNHLFLPSKTGSFAEYSKLSTTVVPSEVLDAIANWISALN